MNEIIKKIWHCLMPLALRDWLYAKRLDMYDRYINWCKYHYPKVYADYLFKNTFGYGIDWKHPRDLNEVINVLAFTTDTSEWTRLADKYRVREFVKERGCEEILVPLYGHWDKVEDIDLNSLPDKFVLKCNNGSGDVCIVKDKKEWNSSKDLSKLSHCLSSSFGLEYAEPHYLKIKPCIISEQLLEPGNIGLVDYKIWCFNGKPYCILTCCNRNYKTCHSDLNLYTLSWENKKNCISENFRNDKNVPQPVRLNEMLNYARKLSSGFPQVRVDFYEILGQIYFGEMTFTSACGRMEYFTPEYLREMGNQIKL